MTDDRRARGEYSREVRRHRDRLRRHHRTIRFGPPRTPMPIIIGRGYWYDVTHDGRILALVTSERRAARPLTLVQNWRAGVRGN